MGLDQVILSFHSDSSQGLVLDQVVQMAEAGLTSVYISGWQSSSTASTSNEPGPDLADYPMDTVPNKCEQLFKAQHFHDRKQMEFRMRQTAEWRAENPPTDYMNPIIADADTGHGGLTATMKFGKFKNVSISDPLLILMLGMPH